MGGSGGSGLGNLGNTRALEERAKQLLQQGRKNVFISFAHEDLDVVNLLRGQAKNDRSDIEFNDRSVHEPYDSVRAEYIRARLAERINQSSTTVVFLSENTAQSSWVKWEVEKSLELGKRVIVVHTGNRAPSNTPSWVNEHGLQVAPWSGLANKIDSED